MMMLMLRSGCCAAAAAAADATVVRVVDDDHGHGRCRRHCTSYDDHDDMQAQTTTATLKRNITTDLTLYLLLYYSI